MMWYTSKSRSERGVIRACLLKPPSKWNRLPEPNWVIQVIANCFTENSSSSSLCLLAFTYPDPSTVPILRMGCLHTFWCSETKNTGLFTVLEIKHNQRIQVRLCTVAVDDSLKDGHIIVTCVNWSVDINFSCCQKTDPAKTNVLNLFLFCFVFFARCLQYSHLLKEPNREISSYNPNLQHVNYHLAWLLFCEWQSKKS